ncbi:MAG TPA: hypothetical protein VLQ93_25255, partial [Myxococcaceae bacterium]|nr:hypothetical protein [Myxococcaceae bacterium]
MRKTWFTAGVVALALGLGGAAPSEKKPHWEATRTPGFFKTHEQALRDCLSKGAVNLGVVTIYT